MKFGQIVTFTEDAEFIGRGGTGLVPPGEIGVCMSKNDCPFVATSRSEYYYGEVFHKCFRKDELIVIGSDVNLAHDLNDLKKWK